MRHGALYPQTHSGPSQLTQPVAMPFSTTSRALSFMCALVFWGVAAVGAHAQISTDPAVPTVNNPVTVQFDASDTPLAGFDGDIYAHTGVYTDQFPEEDEVWNCVKTEWPDNRDDIRLDPVGDDLYELDIEDIRAYYNDNETGCTLGEDEVIQTMNFVFRDTDGETQTDDLIVELGDPDATLSLTITNPEVPDLNPLIVDNGETVTIEAEAVESGEELEEMTLSLDGEEQTSTTETTLSYPLTFNSSGTRTLEVSARGTSGTELSEGFDVVVAPEVADEARPSGIEDGITYNSDTSVTLSMYGPGKEHVYVIGDFNDWTVSNDYAMTRDPSGEESGGQEHWWITIDGLEPGQEYRFQYLVDGEIRMSDPFSAKVLSPEDSFIEDSTYPDLIPYPDDETEGMVSVLEPAQPEFDFSEFERPDPDELVVYELLLRDFVEESTYSTLTDTLSYLDNLGVNAIELMPVSNFDGNLSWGYNPNHHLALDKSYGPPEDFKQFVDEAHQRGIAVILDVVYNHATDRSPLIQVGVDELRGPGHAFNVFNHLNHDHPYIQYWVDRANEHWLTEYNIDGYRFDLTKGFVANDQVANDVNAYNAERVENLRRMATEAWQVDSEAYLIMEHFQRDEELELATHERDQGRQGLMFWQGMNGAYSEAAMGYLNGQSNLRDTYHPNIGLDPEVGNAVTYMESHDQQWLMRKMKEFGNASDDDSYDTTELDAALERQKLMGGFFLTVPGPRMLWQFGELGYGWGEDECLKPGDGSNGDCSASDPGRTGEKPVRWEYNEDPERRAVYETWASLLNLRDEFAPMEALGSVERLDVSNTDDPIRRITLTEGDQTVHIIGNFALEPSETDFSFAENGTWYDFFPGEAVEVTSDNRSSPITLQPSEFHVFTSEPVSFPAEDWTGYGVAEPGRVLPPELVESIDPQSLVLNGEAFAADLGAVFTNPSGSDDDITFEATSSNEQVASVSLTDAQLEVTAEGAGQSTITVAASTEAGGTTEADFDVTVDRLAISVARGFGGAPESAANYRLVALPGNAETALGETVAGEAERDWQAFWDDGSDADFLIRFDDSETFTFRPGRGFWLTIREDWTYEAEIDALALDETGTTSIPLHDGWNIISNPLDASVDWSAVEGANDGSLNPVWSFDGSFSEASTFSSAMEGTAYYFLNDDRDELVIPSPNAESSTTATAETDETTPESLELTAYPANDTADEGPTSTVRMSVQGNADPVIAPPTSFEAVSLRLQPGEDATENERTNLRMADYRALSGEGETFNLELSSERDGEVTLSARNLGAVHSHEVALIDPAENATYDLRTNEQITLAVDADETRRLQVAVGSSAYIDGQADELTPTELTLTTYPNPVRSQATMEYTLPEADDVRLEVYDMLGRRVQVIEDRSREAGTYEVPFDTDGLASGVYFGRLQVDGETRTKKITVVR